MQRSTKPSSGNPLERKNPIAPATHAQLLLLIQGQMAQKEMKSSNLRDLIDGGEIAELTHLLKQAQANARQRKYRSDKDDLILVDFAQEAFLHIHNSKHPESMKQKLTALLIAHNIDYVSTLLGQTTPSKLASRIIACGGKAQAQMVGGYSALHAACFDPILSAKLLKAGANINSCDLDHKQLHHGVGTPLHLLLANENFAKAEQWIRSAQNQGHNIDYSLKDGEGKTLLLIAIKIRAPVSLIRLILENTLKQNKHLVNEPDAEGRTPLSMACALGLTEVTEMLLTAHADIHLADKQGNTPLHCTAFTKAEVDALLESIEINPRRHAKALRNTLSDHTNQALNVNDSELKSIGLEACVIGSHHLIKFNKVRLRKGKQREHWILSSYTNADNYLKSSISLLETITEKVTQYLLRNIKLAKKPVNDWFAFKKQLKNFHTVSKTEQLAMLTNWENQIRQMFSTIPAEIPDNALPASPYLINQLFQIIKALMDQREVMSVAPNETISDRCRQQQRPIARLLLERGADPLRTNAKSYSYFDLGDDKLLEMHFAKQPAAESKITLTPTASPSKEKRVVRKFHAACTPYFRKLQLDLAPDIVREEKSSGATEIVFSFPTLWFEQNQQRMRTELFREVTGCDLVQTVPKKN